MAFDRAGGILFYLYILEGGCARGGFIGVRCALLRRIRKRISERLLGIYFTRIYTVVGVVGETL